jgi:bacteriocin biosynthesis cyclodehydratase domain-containing protein
MELNSRTDKVYAVPFQIIEISGGVVLKRGCTEVQIRGAGVGAVIKLLLAATAKEGATIQELCSLFVPAHHQIIENLVSQLVERELLVWQPDAIRKQTPESKLDLLYWHFSARSDEVIERLNSRHIMVLGVNAISRQLALSLTASGVTNFEVVDHSLLRNLEFFDDSGVLRAKAWPTTLPVPCAYTETSKHVFDCLVGTSDFGRSPLLRDFNRVCVDQGRHFVPIVLSNMIGTVGPLVVPGTSACYECLLSRQASHLDVPDLRDAIDANSFMGQQCIGFHPSMGSILADIAAVELMKFYGGVLQSSVGSLIEVNLLATKMTSRKVLKIPRCAVCSPLTARPPITPKKSLFLTSEELVQ